MLMRMGCVTFVGRHASEEEVRHGREDVQHVDGETLLYGEDVYDMWKRWEILVERGCETLVGIIGVSDSEEEWILVWS